ncbi:MAG: response regulator transcription factor [Planctomycetes bacterium]|nr:response regulator transcription factor [Planctomycetota bacterium]
MSRRRELLAVPLPSTPAALRAAAFLDAETLRVDFVLQEACDRRLEILFPPMRCARSEAVLVAALRITFPDGEPKELRPLNSFLSASDVASADAGTRVAMLTSDDLTAFAVRRICDESERMFARFQTWEEMAGEPNPFAVVIVDVRRFAPADWDELEQRISTLESPASILAFDDEVRIYRLRQVLQRRFGGYLASSDALQDIARTIQEAAVGRQSFSVTAQQHLAWQSFSWQLRPESDTRGVHLLTQRETEIFADMVSGLTSQESASQSGISPSTVENHRAKIAKKLGTRRPLQLFAMAIESGLAKL